MRRVEIVQRLVTQEREVAAVAPEYLAVAADIRIGAGHVEREGRGYNGIAAESEVQSQPHAIGSQYLPARRCFTHLLRRPPHSLLRQLRKPVRRPVYLVVVLPKRKRAE